MRRDYHNWYTHRLNRQMELLAFGHAGTPVVTFPTSRNRFFEYENNGMIQALTPKIDVGELQIFCVDGIDNGSWYNKSIHPHDRVQRQVAFEEYILLEVLPFIKGVNGGQKITTTGCSLGGYQAMNLSLRHPDVISACITMSGSFDMKPFMDGYYDDDFYFNNPVDYLPGTSDPWFLNLYRQIRFVVAAGDADICLGESSKMAHILEAKDIPVTLDVWSGGEFHDWPLWRKMAVKFL